MKKVKLLARFLWIKLILTKILQEINKIHFRNILNRATALKQFSFGI